MKFLKYLILIPVFLTTNVKGAQAVKDTKIGEVNILFYDEQTGKYIFKNKLVIHENKKDVPLRRFMTYISGKIKNEGKYGIKFFLQKNGKVFINRNEFEEDLVGIEEESSNSDSAFIECLKVDFTKIKKRGDQLKSCEEVLTSLDKNQTLKKLIKSDENEFYLLAIAEPIPSLASNVKGGQAVEQKVIFDDKKGHAKTFNVKKDDKILPFLEAFIKEVSFCFLMETVFKGKRMEDIAKLVYDGKDYPIDQEIKFRNLEKFKGGHVFLIYKPLFIGDLRRQGFFL